MRFVSKNSNLLIILKPSLPGNHLTGQAPVNGISVKFVDGMVEVKEQSIIDSMKNHPGFNIDFIAVEKESADPFEYLRNDTEPGHVLTEIKYGHAERSVGTKKKTTLNPEVKKYLQEEAKKMAKEMLPGMMKEVLSALKKDVDLKALKNAPQKAKESKNDDSDEETTEEESDSAK